MWKLFTNFMERWRQAFNLLCQEVIIAWDRNWFLDIWNIMFSFLYLELSALCLWKEAILINWILLFIFGQLAILVWLFVLCCTISIFGRNLSTFKHTGYDLKRICFSQLWMKDGLWSVMLNPRTRCCFLGWKSHR